MSWVKVDDHFSEHPKVVAVGLAGQGLYVAGLCYCNRQLTDGAISKPALVVISGLAFRAATTLADKLVAVGLWERTGLGYQIHDYLRYQDSRAKVLAKRDSDLKRKRGDPTPHSDQIPIGIPTDSNDFPQTFRADSSGSPPLPSGSLPGSLGSAIADPPTKDARVRILGEVEIAEFIDQFPEVNVADQAERYLDWLKTKPKGYHRDQCAGFRNWLKRERDRYREAHAKASGPSTARNGRFSDAGARADARLRGGP